MHVHSRLFPLMLIVTPDDDYNRRRQRPLSCSSLETTYKLFKSSWNLNKLHLMCIPYSIVTYAWTMGICTLPQTIDFFTRGPLIIKSNWIILYRKGTLWLKWTPPNVVLVEMDHKQLHLFCGWSQTAAQPPLFQIAQLLRLYSIFGTRINHSTCACAFPSWSRIFMGNSAQDQANDEGD